MAVTDIKWGARELLMQGMQMAIERHREENEAAKERDAFANEDVVTRRMVKEFRRIEKMLGFIPGSWGAGV